MHWLVLLLKTAVTVNPSFTRFPKPGHVQKKNTLNYAFCPSTAPFSPLFAALFLQSAILTGRVLLPIPDGADWSTDLRPARLLDTAVCLTDAMFWGWVCQHACVCEKDGRHYNWSHMRFLWQRVDSLHWTMKCSNLVLLWIDGLWMSTRWGQLWYMGIPSSPWVLLRSAGVSLAWLFWLSRLCLNLHSQSKVLWWSKATICKASFNGVLMTKLERSFFCLHSRRN